MDAAWDALQGAESAADGDAPALRDAASGDDTDPLADARTVSDGRQAGEGVSDAPLDVRQLEAQGWQVVFLSAFDEPSPGFPGTPVSVCGGFGSLLGGAGLLGLKDKITLPLTLPPHTEIHVVFDLVAIDSWDREMVHVNLDRRQVAEIYCGKGGSTHCNRNSNQCGSEVAENEDGQVRVEVTSAHSASRVDVVIGSVLDQARPDESWGLNNLAVLVR